ncbi:MAG: fasciclin domain-containing protein [Prevotella sp.]|nr:fasciclin domain-containing protein [Prevotella sp.]
MMMAAVVFGSSCSDEWNEHYEESSSTAGTLWEAIQSQGNLSNFSRVVKACGYDAVLNGSQNFSVFAPTDDVFSSAEADSLIAAFQEQNAQGTRSDENTVVRQFLQNHIALYKHPVSSLTNDSITMMNSKYQLLTSSSLGASNFLTSNALCNNGVLFTVDKKLDYFPNVFEYLDHDSELDSVYNFLNSFSVYEFNAAKSVPGEIVDGQTVYLDSVSDYTNILFDKYGKINSEDSTYWMVAPTNSEWNRLLAEYEPYFVYAKTVNKYDSLSFVNSRLAILGGSFFSRTNQPDVAFRDSAMSTSARTHRMREVMGESNPYYIYQKPFDAGGVFDGAEQIECSNGVVLKESDYKISKYETFMQEIKVEAESTFYLDSIAHAVDPLEVKVVQTDNPFYGKISGNTFVEVIPNPATAAVSVRFKIPNVLSNVPYDIYVVTVPGTAADTLDIEEGNKPTIVRQNRLEWLDENGSTSFQRPKPGIETKGGVVDSVLLAESVVFPTCSSGLTEPQVKLTLTTQVTNKQTATHTRTLRLDCIIFKPHQDATDEENAKRNVIN